MSESDLEESEPQTPLEAEPENRLGSVTDQELVNGSAEWNGPDYATVPVPDEAVRPKWEWDYEERQAFFFMLLRKHGTPSNLPLKQSEYAEKFDVTQQQISKDIERVRRYIAAHAGQHAVSQAEMIAQRTIDQLAEEDPKEALDAYLRYCEFLFDLGALDRAPDKKQVQTYNVNENASDALDDDDREKFDQFVDMMTGADGGGEDDAIDVEAEVDE